MATIIETCDIKRITISEISKLDAIYSFTVFVYGISWSVNIFVGGSWLCVDLDCNNDDDSSNWAIPGVISCKLLSFSDDSVALEKSALPFVYDRNTRHGNTMDLIKLDDLFNQSKNFVKDDAIKLEIKIEVENPNQPKKCDATIWRGCKNAGEFQLILKNVSCLMAVRAHPFKLFGLSWRITVGKNSQSNRLFACIDFDESTTKDSCDVTWSIKLITTKEGVRPIEKTETDREVASSEYLLMDIASWDEVVNPENGFIINDSITVEFGLKKSTQRRSTAQTAKRAKRNPTTTTSSASESE